MVAKIGSVYTYSIKNHVWNKAPDVTFYTLNFDGSRTEWSIPRYEPQSILLEGSVRDCAAALLELRGRNHDLCRATGWQMNCTFKGDRQSPKRFYATVWWEPTPEGVELDQQPLPSIAWVFENWHKNLDTD